MRRDLIRLALSGYSVAGSDGIALAGKQSIRFKSRLRRLVPD
ncbi:hypothetical protein [Bradyrhizobium sp.]